MITIRNLNKTYITPHSRIEALKDVNIQIDKGEIYGIIGFSGAGKSTLIRCINRLEEPDSGSIIIEDKDITRMSELELKIARRRIGMIFQQFNLLDSMTVFQNVAFPLKIAGYDKKKINERVHEILELVDLNDKLNSYPAQLSGGQKQRVGIARALANNPEVLLSDEATSALDPQTTYSILELLKDINKKLNITIILITHELDVLKHICDRMSVIENGRIVEEGITEKFFLNPESDTAKKFVRILQCFEEKRKFSGGGEGI